MMLQLSGQSLPRCMNKIWRLVVHESRLAADNIVADILEESFRNGFANFTVGKSKIDM